nr:keratin, type II cytoskeletal 3-like [Cherax quadricarinatus]
MRMDPFVVRGLVEAGWAGYPSAGYSASYLGSSLTACPSGHAHAHITSSLPPTLQREGAIAEAMASSSHLSLMTEHRGGDGNLTLSKDLLSGPPSVLPPAVSVATSLGMLGGGASILGGGVNGLGGGTTVLGGGANGLRGGANGLGGGASMLGGGVSVIGGGVNGLGGVTSISGGGTNLLGGGPGVYLTPPILPASILYSSLCSALPHTPTSSAPPSVIQEDMALPSSSSLPPLSRVSPSTGHRPPDPVWRPY